MEKTFLYTIALLMLINTSFAFSPTYTLKFADREVLTSQINFFESDDDHWLSDYNVSGGNVLVDVKNESITLMLNLSQFCPSNRLCNLSLKEETVEIQLVNVHSNSCGSIVYLGAATNEDFSKEIVKIIDNRANICPTFNELPDTEVEYLITTSQKERYRAYFKADKLIERNIPLL